MESGVELIAKERKEQIEKHGWTEQHDRDTHYDGSIDKAFRAVLNAVGEHDLKMFPIGWENFGLKVINKSYKEKLIIVGALIAAEIDRLNSTQHHGIDG